MAETLKTKVELRQKVLEDLAVIAIGDSVPGELVDKVDAEIQIGLENLEDENLLIFDATVATNVAVIPARIFQAIAELVAYQVMPCVGLGKPDEAHRDAALRRLRRSIMSGDTTTTEACYY